MTIKRGTLKKLCNAKKWPPEASIIMPPVYEADHPDSLTADARPGRRSPLPHVWFGAAVKYPSYVISGEYSNGHTIAQAVYFAALFEKLWVKIYDYLPQILPPWVQTSYFGLDFYDCAPWTGAWPTIPPDVSTLLLSDSDLVWGQELIYDLDPATLPRIYALQVTGSAVWTNAGSRIETHAAWLTLGGGPDRGHFEP